ncbi:tektin-4-like [Athalia rosae]|uniref:tektin-4-like n=1 Tax=Athalia rosae TaxID=37344 RepID=UPI0020339528|nr:tektin-4-like [Athalia rosae]
MQPGPLGPLPVPTAEGNIPLDYWTPLADLTKTRPAVENLSLSRYSPSELREHVEKLTKSCNDGIQAAALTGYNARRCALRAYAVTDRNQLDNNIRLSARAGTIYCWKSKLDRIVSKIREEIDAVLEVRRRTMRAKSALQLVDNIGKDIMNIRCYRMDTDLVRDQVTEEISKSLQELSLCDEIRDLYNRLLDQIVMQIEELKAAKQRLEFDWSEKTEAYEIDVDSRGFNSDSEIILWKSGAARLPPDQSSPSGYQHSVEQAIAEGETARERSNGLRANLDSIIKKAARDLRKQADKADLALMEQIKLHEQTLRRLDEELRRDLKQIADTESLIDEMRNASRRLDGAMKCAQTRLDNRLHRHGDESCRDVPQFGLIEQMKSIAESVTSTLSQLKRAEDSMAALIQSKNDLERELVIKRKSLYVDRDRCQRLRIFYPSVQTLAGN